MLMKRIVPALVTVATLLSLAGCGLGSSAPSVPGSTQIGHLSGSVYGGRAPISGSELFLFGTGTTGYGGKNIPASATNAATSLLTATTYSDGFATTMDNSGDATNGDYYVTTDVNGAFNLDGDYTCVPGTVVYLYALGGYSASTQTAPNPQIGQLAVLGACPAGGTFAGQTPGYVYMNEVSTVAAAYVMSPFASDAIHISSGASALAIQGIDNAAAAALQLYNLFSPSNAAYLGNSGANAVTPNGNGTVPQSTINTLSNILVQCINSSNTAAATGSTCNTLRSYATNDGTTGTLETTGYAGAFPADEPSDTATAIINIAQHPVNNVINLCNQQGSGAGIVYTPNLTCTAAVSATTTSKPNDWNLNITYTGGGLQAIHYLSPKSLAIDGSGNVWTDIQYGGGITGFSPLGVPLVTNTYAGTIASFAITKAAAAVSGNTTYTGTFTGGASNAFAGKTFIVSGYVSPYTANNGTFTCSASTATTLTLNNPSGVARTATAAAAEQGTVTAYPTGGNPLSVAVDSSGNIWTANFTGNNITKVTPAMGGTAFTTTNYAPGTLAEPDDLQFDGSGNIFISNPGTAYATTSTVVKATSAGVFTSQATPASNGLLFPSALALGAGATGAVYVAEEANSDLSLFGNALAAVTFKATNASTAYVLNTVAVDASGNGWVTEADTGANNFLVKVTTGGVLTTYQPGSYNYYIQEYDGDAIDGDGNVWATDSDIGMIYEVSSRAVGSVAAGTILSDLGTGANLYGFEPVGNVAGHTSAGSAGITVALNAIAIDGSGNVWYNTAGDATLREMVGAATPVVTPMQAAVSQSLLGQTPAIGSVAVTLAPSPLAFGSQTATTSTTLAVTLTNNGVGFLTVNNITVSDIVDYTETNTCVGTPVTGNGGTCTISVTFTPLTTGSLPATLSVYTNASNAPYTDAITGSGM